MKTINGSSLIGSGDIQIEGGGDGIHKWEGTRAEYNALSAYDENTLYVITDEDVEYATQQWVTNKGYLTSHQSLTDYAKKSELKTINGSSLIGSGDIQIEGGGNGVQKWEGTRAEYNALSAYDENTLYVITDEDVEYATQQWVTNQGYLTTHQSLTDYAKKTDLSTYAKKAEVEAKQDKLTNTETLTFLMEDGTSVEKTIYLK